MTRIWICTGLLVTLVLVTGTWAFHENIRACRDGDMGYIATMVAEGGKVYTFLSSQDPPNADTVICQIPGQQLIQVKGGSKKL